MGEIDRRAFFRLIGAAAAPLIVPGCLSEVDEEGHDLIRLRDVNPSVVRSIKVRRARNNQPILGRPEHLSIDDDLAVYLSLGDQCRVVRSNGRVALYTVGDVRSEKGNKRVRMSEAARERLGTSGIFSAKLHTQVVAEGLTDEEAKDQSEFVERLVDDGEQDELVVLAPHGGSIELRTELQAEYMRSRVEALGRPVSSWICLGYKKGGGAFDQWHITSTDLSPNSFPGLDALVDRGPEGAGFTNAVIFHGLSGDNVIVGGGAPMALKDDIRQAIDDAFAALDPPLEIEVTIATGNEGHSGDSTRNVVNWLTKDGVGGIQISSSKAVRLNKTHREAIVDAIIAVLYQPVE
ncbi:poly-gamma-glutamate hydrolase family protein [Enhygromyxa salina]|uniref:poly-gamma-glutamate hydrolase family protein n=1 Tax=Enhygromyxa salina TaxID=215803 RepID=UPI0015E5F3BD|nr:poly-gamma-glutamate hydrolase family protein [Enhygromyxa salina]